MSKKMKILVFSMAPIFKDYVHGGSQKILRELLKYLGKKHRVEVLCTMRSDNNKEFVLFPGVKVRPILPFKETYPEPYYTAPFHLANAVEILQEAINRNEVIYVHDSEMNFFFLYEANKPFICSLREFVYPDTLIGAFNFRRDRIIVNSVITKENVKYTIGRYMSDIVSRIEVILNGFDLNFFKRTTPKEINLFIPKLNSKNVILYPHRPDERKGIFGALELIYRLKYKHNIKDVKLLIPEWIDMSTEGGKKSYYGNVHYRGILDFAKNKGIEKNIVFHPWIPFNFMPQYYSLGKLTLCTGRFVEAFGGNSSIESILCGTPVVLSRVGAQRTTLPEEVIDKIDVGDTDDLERKAIKILKKGKNLIPAQKFIEKNYNFQRMLKSYEKVFINAKPLPKILPHFKKFKLNFMIKLAPWCYLTKEGKVYNDYLYSYKNITQEMKNLIKNGKKFSLKEVSSKFLIKEIKELINIGILVYEIK